MRQLRKDPIKNYKHIFLAMGLINLLWLFAMIWTFYGMAAVLVLAATLNHLITRLDLKLARDAYFGRQ